MVTESALDLEVRNRMFHEGDNRSCNLYPVKLDSYKQPCVWKASAAVKAQVFGPSNIVGNPSANYIPVEAAEGEESYIDKFGDEPVFSQRSGQVGKRISSLLQATEEGD